MASTMTDVSVFLFVVASNLLLSTGFDHFLTILFTRPSTPEGQKLLTAIEDMVLPMGSFPSRLLNPWSTTPKPENSSPLLATSDSESKQEAVPAPDEPIYLQDTTNNIPILSFSPLTAIEIEPRVDATSPAVNDVLAEFHVFEKEIRGLIDPEEIHLPQLKSTRDLVADMINKDAEAANDMRRDWAKEKEEFERNIRDHDTKYHELERDHNILSKEMELEKEKSSQLETRKKCLDDQIEEKIQDKKDAETKADKAVQVANAAVQKRIDEVRIGLEQNKKIAVDKIKQERDSVMLSKKKIETELADACSEVNLLKEQQKTVAKKTTKTLNEYRECLRKRNLAVTNSEHLKELAERSLEALRNKRLMKDSNEVAHLQKQLRASKDLAKSLEPYKTKAENHERIYRRLEEKSTNSEDTIREEKDHIINRLKSEANGHRTIMAAGEVTINRQRSKIARLKSGKELEELKSKLEQVKKQLENAELETENLRRDLKTGDAKSKQDVENALMELKGQHEEEKRIAVADATQRAEKAAAGKAVEKEAEYEQRTRSAAQDAMNHAAEKAAEKEADYEQRTRLAVQDAMNHAAEKAAERAAEREQEYEVAMRAAIENATTNAVVNTKMEAAVGKAAAEVEKQAARETKMDIEPDPELDAELMDEVEDALRQEHQKNIDEAVKNAVEKALENAKQLHQQQMDQAVQRAVQNAKINHEKEKNDLIAAKEAAEFARQTQEAPDNEIQTKSSGVADRQTSNNPIDLTLAATEAHEASKLLDEVVKNGVAVDTVEHTVLRRLTDIRGALHNLKATLQMPHAPTETSHYQDILRGFRLEEPVLERLENETNHKLLVRQGRLANERLRKVSEILETSGVQKDEILQALIGPKRQVAPIRGLKRPAQSKKPKVDNGQPSADVPPTPSAQPKADNRQSFADILKSLQNS